MNALKGWRKVIILTEGLTAMVLTLWLLQIKDAGAIVAVGTQVSLLSGAAIYGNVKEHQLNNKV